MRLYAKVGQALIRAKEAGNDAFIEQILSWEQFTENLREAEKLARSEDFDYLAILGDHYPQTATLFTGKPGKHRGHSGKSDQFGECTQYKFGSDSTASDED